MNIRETDAALIAGTVLGLVFGLSAWIVAGPLAGLVTLLVVGGISVAAFLTPDQP